MVSDEFKHVLQQLRDMDAATLKYQRLYHDAQFALIKEQNKHRNLSYDRDASIFEALLLAARADKRVDAIKCIRDLTGWELKETRDIVDRAMPYKQEDN